MIALMLGVYYGFGIGVLLVWRAHQGKRITLGDLAVSLLGALLWPMFALVMILFWLEKFTIWRKK